ncbi:MAG: hypothetical protein ACMG6E_06700 [Candidatus Roizmanbacteria bacterium]
MKLSYILLLSSIIGMAAVQGGALFMPTDKAAGIATDLQNTMESFIGSQLLSLRIGGADTGNEATTSSLSTTA